MENVAEALQALGGAKIVLSTAPSAAAGGVCIDGATPLCAVLTTDGFLWFDQVMHAFCQQNNAWCRGFRPVLPSTFRIGGALRMDVYNASSPFDHFKALLDVALPKPSARSRRAAARATSLRSTKKVPNANVRARYYIPRGTSIYTNSLCHHTPPPLPLVSARARS